MGHVTKDERILRPQFRALVSRLFGPAEGLRGGFRRRESRGAGGMRV